MKKTLTLIIGFIIFQTGFAQEQPTRLSLQEAIDYALENNRSTINASRDIEAAKQQKWETTASGLPQVSASIDYQNNLKQQVSLLPASAFDPLSGIRQLADYYDLEDLQTQQLPDVPQGFLPITFGTKHSMTAFATLNQKIFDGSYLVGLQSAKVFLEISKNAKIKTDLEVRKAVIEAYGNVLLAEESIKIFERNIDVLEKNLFETQKIYENGLGEEESVEQLQITLSGVKSNLNNVERLKKLAYQMLNINLGLDVQNTMVLTDSLETLTDQNISLSDLDAENNPENTIDYLIAQNDTKAKELMVKLEKSKALPTLNAFINAGYSGYGDEFNFAKKSQDWFGSSLFGFSLDIPIFSSGMRSASTQRAAINLEKAQTELTETEQRIKLQIESAKSDYQFAIEDYANKKENLGLAERIETKNQTKFFEGIGSSFELRQAQTQLYTAQQELLQAMLDVINSKTALETVLNTPINN
ncbi:outer membrane protein TolC [Winogradskyella pacifica]|uniref:Outer membrane protein TolC n=1 Tax=Winogradskyella pacifica TaxID=664642 RepID=A0A3D9MAM2_9FLAO|nr:TolC family protein [Winogradskyella pacifica]REE16895.1 outer membrane protein TolC [Winogradskyella pacifica]